MCSSPGEGSDSRLTHVVGRIQFLAAVGLKSSGSCRLFVGSHCQLLKAVCRSLPLPMWQLASSDLAWE